MKKINYFFTLAIVLAVSIILMGCNESNFQSIFKKVDGLYLTIRAVVTDPEIRVMIPQDKMDRLAEMENGYLIAKNAYIKTSDVKEGQSAIEILLSYSGDFMSIFDSIPAMAKYHDQITAARITIKVLGALSPG